MHMNKKPAPIKQIQVLYRKLHLALLISCLWNLQASPKLWQHEWHSLRSCSSSMTTALSVGCTSCHEAVGWRSGLEGRTSQHHENRSFTSVTNSHWSHGLWLPKPQVDQWNSPFYCPAGPVSIMRNVKPFLSPYLWVLFWVKSNGCVKWQNQTHYMQAMSTQ